MTRDIEQILDAGKYRVVRCEYTLADGKIRSKPVVRHHGAVVILPLLEDNRVCLIRNYRPAIDRELIELPAGTLDPGEEPLACAERELAEETGYRGGTFEPLQRFFPSPGFLDERMHVFVARNLVPGPPRLEPDEQIENLPTDWDEALRMIADGRIEDGKTILILLRYDYLRRGLLPG